MPKKKTVPSDPPGRQKRTGTPRLPYSASLSVAVMAALEQFATEKRLNMSAAGAELLGRALRVPKGKR